MFCYKLLNALGFAASLVEEGSSMARIRNLRAINP
jgi:hypothetical protein